MRMITLDGETRGTVYRKQKKKNNPKRLLTASLKHDSTLST